MEYYIIQYMPFYDDYRAFCSTAFNQHPTHG